MAKRDHVIKLCTIKALQDLELELLITDKKLIAFLDKIFNTYDQSVQYHNDLHGADVLQQMFYIIKTCGLN